MPVQCTDTVWPRLAATLEGGCRWEKGYVNSVGEAQEMLKGKTERVTENYSRMTPLALATLMALVQPICAASRNPHLSVTLPSATQHFRFRLPLRLSAA